MKQALLILTVCLIVTSTSLAQSALTPSPACGFGLLQQYRRQADPLLRQRLNKAETIFQQQLAKQRGARAQEIVYTVPIVVHVIHNGEPVGTGGNPSDTAIQAMISVLNAGFRKNGAQFGGVDIGIQFQLASRSPQCGTTTGINRINGSSVTNYTAGGIANSGDGTYPGSADELAIKALSRWPNVDYINIWIVNKINVNSGLGGFAFMPELNSALTDGIVVKANTVDASNKTIVHEMGHVFNLYHTFHDYDYGPETNCPASTSCATTGDQVCDTEPVLNVPCSATQNSCTGAPFQIADASLNYTVQNNYMGYTDCQWMFTQGQKDRIRAALLDFRGGLLTSGALSPPAASPPVDCSVTAANGLSQYYGVGRVTFGSLDVYSNTSRADGAFYVDRTCNQRTTLTAGQSYSLTVLATYENPEYLQAYLDYNGDGDFNDAGETLVATTGGSVTATVTIPTSGFMLNKPLRLRIVGDNIGGTTPTACNLIGTAQNGSGQIEDYTVLILPRTVTSIVSGSWTSPGTWSCACIPGSTDQVTIQTEHTVSVPSGVVQAWNMNLSGRLSYATGGRVQLTGN